MGARMRPALSLVIIMQRVVVIPYRRYRTTYLSNLKIQRGYPETLEKNDYSLRNNPEERSSHLLSAENLKTRMDKIYQPNDAEGS
jgi:hypothetical protein